LAPLATEINRKLGRTIDAHSCQQLRIISIDRALRQTLPVLQNHELLTLSSMLLRKTLIRYGRPELFTIVAKQVSRFIRDASDLVGQEKA
jgi:hypothetical protein